MPDKEEYLANRKFAVYFLFFTALVLFVNCLSAAPLLALIDFVLAVIYGVFCFVEASDF